MPATRAIVWRMRHPRPFWTFLLQLVPVALAAGVLDEPHLSPALPATTPDIRGETPALTTFEHPEPGEARAGGDTSIDALRDRNAFSRPSANMVFEREVDFLLGNELFRRVWDPAGEGDANRDGLGPLYNAKSCEACHLRDGRGQPPFVDPGSPALFLRLSAANGQPDPVYGSQLQTAALAGFLAEGRLNVTYRTKEIPLAGGERAHLLVPSYAVGTPGYGPLAGDTGLSPRLAPPMIGLGLLEAVPAADILSLADPEDSDGDGISGRPSRVWSPEFTVQMLGRFGLKSGAATIRQQTAAALRADMGLSTSLFPEPWGECTPRQITCRAGPHGGRVEVDREDLDRLVFYSRNLAVPVRDKTDAPDVLRGKQVFYQTGCTGCHRPSFVTHTLPDRPEQSAQTIWPYSDLLLHDMGEGLADTRDLPHAKRQEWRTAPLWGIGRTREVSGHEHYLHDGRARTLLEAVLWHGGEAAAQRDAVIDMAPKDRAALIRYLESL